MPKAATQQFLEVNEVKEGVIVLKNNALRGVLMVSSLNFALKSDDEQTAIVFRFQNFLNSLDFSLEIITQSRRLNITGYLDKLKSIEESQTSELLKMQAAGYQRFIRELIVEGSIMSKTFFVVVPFTLLEVSRATKEEKQQKDSGRRVGRMSEEFFRRARNQLWQRMEYTASGLRGCGLSCAALNTADLIELFWSLHHPEEAEIGYYPEIPPELLGETMM